MKVSHAADLRMTINTAFSIQKISKEKRTNSMMHFGKNMKDRKKRGKDTILMGLFFPMDFHLKRKS
jgi:hypothetical protein